MAVIEIPIEKIFQDRHSDSFFVIQAFGTKVKVHYLELLGRDYVSETPPIIKIKDHPDNLGIDYKRNVLRIHDELARATFPFEKL